MPDSGVSFDVELLLILEETERGMFSGKVVTANFPEPGGCGWASLCGNALAAA